MVELADTEQLEVVAFTLTSVQGETVNEADAVPLLVNATVPRGAEAVPAADVSLTNAVQLVDWPMTIVAGEHVMAVEVVRRLTVTVFPAVGPLPLCAVSDDV